MHSLVLSALVLSAALQSTSPTHGSEALSRTDSSFVTAQSAESESSGEAVPEPSNPIPVLKRLAIRRPPTPVKLTVVPPADARVQSGDPADPALLGFAKVESATERGVQITYRDIDLGLSACPTDAVERELRRVWTATDVAGNTGTCTQMLTVMRRVASLDVRPGSCPNEYKIGPGGLLSMSIAGRPDFDVRQIDASTVELWTASCTDGPIEPAQVKIEDNATPYTGTDGGCHTAKKDGRPDLSLRFTSQTVANGLHLKSYPTTSPIKLVVTGKLTNGATFIATDSVRLK